MVDCRLENDDRMLDDRKSNRSDFVPWAAIVLCHPESPNAMKRSRRQRSYLPDRYRRLRLSDFVRAVLLSFIVY